jgi:uncharacterized protein (TIGR04255 family)
MVIPAELPQNHDVFHVRTEIPYEQGRDRLAMTLSSVPATDTDKISIMLDFDYVMFVPDAVQLNQVESWLDNSHKVIEDAFESSITEKCRTIFAGDEGDAAVCI